MCGLTGFVGTGNNTYDIFKIKLLMLYNETRGRDSSGIYTGGQLLKVKGKVSENLLTTLDIPPSNILIGHTRQATSGYPVNEENIHPFESKDLVLAHNGTLKYIYDLAQEEKLDYHYQKVDSLYALELFQKYYKQNDPKLVISKLEGIANFLIVDKNNPNRLYVYKHPDRTLFRGKAEEGLYISSIKESLEAINCTDIKEFKDNYFYTLEDGKVKNQIQIKMKERVYVNSHISNVPNREWRKFGIGRILRATVEEIRGNHNSTISCKKDQLFVATSNLSGELDNTLKVKYSDPKENKIIETPYVFHRNFKPCEIELYDFVKFINFGFNHLKVVKKLNKKTLLFEKTEEIKYSDTFVVMDNVNSYNITPHPVNESRHGFTDVVLINSDQLESFICGEIDVKEVDIYLTSEKFIYDLTLEEINTFVSVNLRGLLTTVPDKELELIGKHIDDLVDVGNLDRQQEENYKNNTEKVVVDEEAIMNKLNNSMNSTKGKVTNDELLFAKGTRFNGLYDVREYTLIEDYYMSDKKLHNFLRLKSKGADYSVEMSLNSVIEIIDQNNVIDNTIETFPEELEASEIDESLEEAEDYPTLNDHHIELLEDLSIKINNILDFQDHIPASLRLQFNHDVMMLKDTTASCLYSFGEGLGFDDICTCIEDNLDDLSDDYEDEKEEYNFKEYD